MLVSREVLVEKDTNRAGTSTKVSENLNPVFCDATVLLMLVCQWEAKIY